MLICIITIELPPEAECTRQLDHPKYLRGQTVDLFLEELNLLLQLNTCTQKQSNETTSKKDEQPSESPGSPKTDRCRTFKTPPR